MHIKPLVRESVLLENIFRESLLGKYAVGNCVCPDGVSYFVPPSGYSVAVGDFNGDGIDGMMHLSYI